MENASEEVVYVTKIAENRVMGGARGSLRLKRLVCHFYRQQVVYRPLSHVKTPSYSVVIATVRRQKDDANKCGTTASGGAILSLERHLHLLFNAMICYCFASNCCLQDVEFAIGFETFDASLGLQTFFEKLWLLVVSLRSSEYGRLGQITSCCDI
ncbi:hypothetical protein DD237_007868 [Peronospora effusa]|uniref:Uncharacterized protein n=1 Tax=Peronospora effusa TaxID=542832 RepID=A0A425C3F4_9STRA|nr:hypothetical protein DD237_007868 [Peronospora effusa]